MLDAMKAALEGFSRDPVSFMLPSLIYVIFMAITLGACVGVLLLAFVGLTALSVDAGTVAIALGVMGFLLLVLFGIFSAGYKGALANEYYNALHGNPVGVIPFMQYAFRNALSFFVISFVKIGVMGFLISPLSLIYYFFDLGTTSPILAWIVILLAVFIMFVVEFLFAFSYIGAVVKKVRPFTAIMLSFNFIAHMNVQAFLIYLVYCVVVVGTLLPIVNFFIYFIFYPLAYASLIRLFEQKSVYMK